MDRELSDLFKSGVPAVGISAVGLTPEMECMTTFRCSREHPRFKGQLCNAKLAELTLAQLEAMRGVPIWCWRCKKSTQFD